LTRFETEIRDLRWLGDSKKRLKQFPKDVQSTIGFQLYLVQSGEMPTDSKPFKNVGSGVFELAIRYNKDAYRTVLAVQLGDCIYVLHVFQKKSKRGIATPKQDVDLIKQRYNEAKEMVKNEE